VDHIRDLGWQGVVGNADEMLFAPETLEDFAAQSALGEEGSRGCACFRECRTTAIPRASYLLVDRSTPSIRRVEYEVDKEVMVLSSCGLPHADWIGKMLASARPQMP
jgi:hypothetical protein